MMRRLLSVFLLLALGVSGLSMVSCGGTSSQQAVEGDALFRFVDIVLNYNDVFTVAPDTILLAKDAFQLYESIPANQSPPAETQTGITEVSILYLKQGVYTQDIYKVKTGKASLGILFEGGRTFESISTNRVDIDATQTHQIWMVPLQNATSTVTVSAKAGWQNTGIFLVRGKQYQIKYLKNVWTISKGKVNTSDAAGQPLNPPQNILCQCGEPLPGYSTQALIGRVGSGLGNAPSEVGDDFVGVSYDNDFLYLRINLADALLPFADGSVTVSVTTDNASQ